MKDNVKEKVKKAIQASKERKIRPSTSNRCPLKCWDVFAMSRADQKYNK